MNRRSNTEKVEKYTLVKFDVDGGIGVCATNQIKAEGKIVIGACCEAPFKNKYYSAVVLNMDGKFGFLYELIMLMTLGNKQQSLDAGRNEGSRTLRR